MENKLREELAWYTREVYRKGYTSPLNGNMSMRLDDRHILITPSTYCKGLVKAEDILKVDMDGNVIGSDRKTSIETGMHISIYKKRPEINAVLHAHPKCINVFAVANKEIELAVMPEAVYLIGEVANIPYYMPGSAELRDAVAAKAEEHDAYLLFNHGMITIGRDMGEAFYRLETLELCAYTQLFAQQIGGAVIIEGGEKERLLEVRRQLKEN